MTVTFGNVDVVDAILGPGVRIIRPSNIYGCRIGQGTFVGPFCEIQRNVIVGRDCRIQSHSFICELVIMGDDCFIGHGVMFINDTFVPSGPARGDRTRWRATKLGNNVSIGSNATLLPVEIADGVIVGAGAVVTRSLLVKGIYGGNPARLVRKL
jgi:acetyltransferase-like isoleucine patch superfamily enzyme